MSILFRYRWCLFYTILNSRLNWTNEFKGKASAAHRIVGEHDESREIRLNHLKVVSVVNFAQVLASCPKIIFARITYE